MTESMKLKILNMQNHIISYKIFMFMNLYCELFRLEDEVIATGIDDIDNNLIGEDSDGQTDDGINTIQGPTQTLHPDWFCCSSNCNCCYI